MSGNVCHVVPARDAVAHLVPGWPSPDDVDGDGAPWLVLRAETSPDDTACPCGPTAEHVPNDGGSDGWVITHHSLDGREQHEPARPT